MATNMTSSNDAEQSAQTLAKAALLTECGQLASAGLTFVAVHFDGYGDSGAIEQVRCYDSDDYDYEEYQAIQYDACHLQQYFEALVPFGYEDGCGGFGDVVLDVKCGKITVERNDRFEDFTTTTYEV